MASVYSHCHFFSHSLSLKLRLGVWNGTVGGADTWQGVVTKMEDVYVPFMISQWASVRNCVPSEKQTHRSNRSKELTRR